MRPERVALPTTDDLAQRLDEGLAALALPLTTDQRHKLLAYLGLLVKWNAVYNLTSVRDPHDMLAVHLLDALSIVSLIDRLAVNTAVDVGSGAGLPGIPLAIARPALTVHSIDAVAKKIGFQQHVKGALALTGFQPSHQRVEAFTLAEMPDLIVSRAYAELRLMVESIAHLAGPATTIIAMKGPDPADEIAALPAGWAVSDVAPLTVPFLGAERTAVILRRAG